MRNLALNRPATQSSTSPWSTNPATDLDASVANDGETERDRFFHTAEEQQPWWQVDLGGLFSIRKVVLYNRSEEKQRLKRFSVLLSVHGHDWVEVAKKDDDLVFNLITIDIQDERVCRFVRIRLAGLGFLHFRECQVFGLPATPEDQNFLSSGSAREPPQNIVGGRCGVIKKIGDFSIFIDDAYGETVRKALYTGLYEWQERVLVKKFLQPTDRVLEIGTAIGVVAMTAASIVGQHHVVSFDANRRSSTTRRTIFCATV